MSEEMKQRMKREYLSMGGAPNVPMRSNPFLLISAIMACLAMTLKLLGYF